MSDHPDQSVVKATLSLYLEAAISDPRIRHTIDLLGFCCLEHPIPTSLLSQHLSTPFYRIPQESLISPLSDPMEQIKKLTGDQSSDSTSYLSQIKAMLPFFGNKPPSMSEISSVLAAGEDRVSFLRDLPLLSFKSYKSSGFEVVQVHSCVWEELSHLFLRNTAPRMDKDHLAREEKQFDQNAWFRSYRTFDKESCLENYHRTLPGISAPGVMTKDEYEKTPVYSADFLKGSKTSGGSRELNYSEYQHIVSHYHRVVTSLSDLLKSAGGDVEDIQLRKYLQPHFRAAGQSLLLSDADKVSCSYGRLSVEAALSPPSKELVKKYEGLSSEQALVFGSKSQPVARTLTDMANMKYSVGDITGAKELLEEALKIYEKVPSRLAGPNFQFEVGLTLSSLAFVYSASGETERGRDMFERALGAYQTTPPDGQVSRRQRKLVTSSLTDVSHAYLSLGNLTMAKKYIDLAVMAHQNLYLEGHSETVRTLNVSSAVYALLGDKPESQRMRHEAGKMKTKVESKPLLA